MRAVQHTLLSLSPPPPPPSSSAPSPAPSLLEGRQGMPVVLLLSGISGLLFIISGSCHKYHFCHDKRYLHNFVATKDVFCCDKPVFVATKLCLLWRKFCCNKNILSWQNFCCDKHTFVSTKDVYCHDKHEHVLLTTKLCRDINDTCGSSLQW